MNSIIELKKFACENQVPIIKDAGLNFLLSQIAKFEVINVLEIGCAIAYSAIQMASNGCDVTTIERDSKMYDMAVANVSDFALTDKIKIIKADALEAYDLVCDKQYDLIFIDAAKAQYKKFFELYTPLLKKGGIVICDNLEFHDLVFAEDTSKFSRSLRALLRKLRDFRDYLSTNKDFITTFYKVGDGMSVSIKTS